MSKSCLAKRVKVAWLFHAGRNRLKEIDEAFASGKITLDRYEAQKADIQKLITEYQEKLEDKSNKLHAKEHELERLTKDAAKARSVIQPFRNHKVDFTPPQIREKVPLFGTDKWIERQNRLIAKQFTEIVRKIESLYRNDAARPGRSKPPNAMSWRIMENYTSYGKTSRRLLKIMMA